MSTPANITLCITVPYILQPSVMLERFIVALPPTQWGGMQGDLLYILQSGSLSSIGGSSEIRSMLASQRLCTVPTSFQ